MPAHCSRVQIILHYSMQPAAHAPPVGYGMPAAFSVRVAGGGRCSVSAVPVALFDGTAEFYVHVEHAGNGDAWLEVWGRALGDMDAAAAAALFEPSGWTRNVVKYITCWTGRNDITPLDACGDFGIFSLALS